LAQLRPPSHLFPVFTSRPDIAYALPPKRTRSKKARVEHPNLPTVALSPKEIERRKVRAALLANVPTIIEARTPSRLPEVDHEKAAQAADRLWQEMVRRVNARD